MKKLFALTLCAMAVVGCDDSNQRSNTTNQASNSEPKIAVEQSQTVESKIKALQPEGHLEKPFTKTESGRVIFNNVIDLFEDEALYSPDDKNIIVHSESPLKLTLKESVLDSLSANDVHGTLEDKFIYDVFEIFAHTNVDKVEITLEAVKENGKPYGKKSFIKGNITRDRALQVLQTYSAMKNFDDYVEFNPEKEFTVLGFSRSDRAEKFNSDKYRKQILAGLLTGKLELPTETVQLPLNRITDEDLGAKMIEVGRSLDLTVNNEKRQLNNGNTESKWLFNQVSTLSTESNKKGDIVKITAQFGFVNEPEYVLQSVALISISSLATSNPDKAFKIATGMIDKIGKKLKKAQGSIKEKEVMDGYTLEMTVHKSLGGLSFFTIEKLEKRPVEFK